MRILVAYPGHSHSTRDVADGYTEALRFLGHQVHPYDYHTRLAFYSEALKHWDVLNPAFEATAGQNLVLASEPIAIECIDFVPDIVLIVCGLVLHRRGYELLHRLGLTAVLLLTESPYLDQEQAEIMRLGHIAGTLTNDQSSVIPLREASGGRVEYLPHSFNPQRHYPQTVESEYESDVFFFGTWWPERQRMFGRLLASQNGHRFNLNGIEPLKEGKDLALIDNEILAMHYCGAKIAVNHHRTISRNDDGQEVHIQGWSLGPRAYEIAACGAFQLSDDSRPELQEVFGDSVATYRDGDDLVAQVEYYLKHENERRAMAAEALRRVQDCTFEARANNIVIPFLTEVLNGSTTSRP